MDRKLNADNQWFVSPLVDLTKFKEEGVFLKNSMKSTVPVDSISDLATILEARAGCSKDTIEQIFDDVLSIPQFLTNPEQLDKNFDEIKRIDDPLHANLLYTHRHLKVRDEYLESSRQRKCSYLSSLKYDRYDFDAALEPRTESENPSEEPKEPEDDILIVVDVVMPYNRTLTSSELRTSRLLKAQTKLLLRGDTTLYDLRQHLACLSDAVVPMEDGRELENPDFSQATAELYPSSFIFIHDTFYLDMSHENSIDISVPIREFMKRKKIFDETFVKEMRDVRIVDLKLRLGQPYVFQHSGNCEHLMVFHDLRMMHPTDRQNLEDYPCPVFEKAGEKKCDACHKENSAYVIEKSELLPNTLTYFCETCFHEFNFTNGIKNNSFKAWPVIALNNLRANH